MAELIAVDLGTTLIKCTLYGDTGETLATESIPCRPTYPKAGWVEQDASLWYEGVCRVLSRLNAYRKQKEVGIAVSSQGISVVPVDADLRPLCPALSWLDNRAEEETAFLAALMPREEWFSITGKFLSPAYTLPKLLWLEKHRPELYAKAHKFLLPMDYLHARMTGRAVTDHTLAAGTMVYDVHAAGWSERLLAAAHLTADRLAEI